MSHPALLCDQCGRDLAADISRGWVRWWLDDDGAIDHFEVVCQGRCEEQRKEEEKRRRDTNLQGAEGPLEEFTGAQAMPRLCRILRERAWSERARREAAAFFVVAALLPTGSAETD